MEEKNMNSGLSLREFLVFFYKYRRRLLLAFGIPFLLAVVMSFVPSPRFQATSVLIVRLGSEYVYQPEVGSSQTSSEMPIPFQQDQIFKSEAAILGSKDLHQETIEALGIDTLFPPNALSSFLGSLKTFVGDAALSLGLKAASEEDVKKRELAAAVEAFDRRFDVVLERESAVINVGFQHKDASIATQAVDTLLKLYMEKRKELYLEPRLKLAQNQEAAARKKVAIATKAVDDYKRSNKLHSLETQRANLLAARNEVEKLRTSLDSPALDQKAEAYNQQLDELDAQEHKFSALENEAQIAKDAYALAVHKVSEAKAFDDLSRQRVGSVRIIQNATVSPNPVRLQPIIILAGFFFAILSFFVVAALTELRRNGFLTPEEVERALRLPVLTVLPYQKDRK